MMEPFRLRLKFDDSVLSDSQKSEGLTRSWVLVEPGHRTVSDFVTFLHHAFGLLDSCPNGIFLSVEGFALPHFESIEILGDTDLVCVKRKESKFRSGDIENEAEGHQNVSEEEDEDAQTDLLDEKNLLKKRKSSKQLKNSKKRKCRYYNSSPQKEHPDSCLQNGYCKPSQKSKQDQVRSQGCNGIDNWEGVVYLSSEPDQTVRVPASQVTRRKNTEKKRRHVAEQLYKEKSQKDLDDAKISDQDSDSGDEITPVLVRPGHIRFTTHGKGKGKDVQQYQGAEESLNWCGITNNSKLTKWGKDKQSPSNQKQPAPECNDLRANKDKQQICNWNENRCPQEKQSGSTWGGNRSHGEWKSGVKWNEYKNRGRNWSAKKAPPTDPLKEYEKLVPLTDFPLEGDIVAYRLLDISSSFCPVMTSYRVGKVLSCDPKTNMVVLVPVPEYPFEFKKAIDDTSSEPADASRYKEDGTLVIDFPSLADVRIVKRGPSGSGWNSNSGSGWWTGTSKWAPASGSGWCTGTPGSSEANMALASTSENGGQDVWEEMIAGVNAKKAEEAKEDSWSKKRKRANYTWIYRTVRRQAAGPDMGAQNGNGGGGGGGQA